MISRYEYLYIKSKIKNMENVIFEYQNGSTYATWEKYLALNDTQKKELEDNWDKYYQDIRNGYYAKQANKAAQAFKINGGIQSTRIVKEIVEEVRQSKVPYIKKPSSIDPEELKMKMHSYFVYINKLNQMKKLVEEFSPVYEGKSSKNDIGEL